MKVMVSLRSCRAHKDKPDAHRHALHDNLRQKPKRRFVFVLAEQFHVAVLSRRIESLRIANRMAGKTFMRGRLSAKAANRLLFSGHRVQTRQIWRTAAR